MDGDLTVESTPGEGTTFTVSVPMRVRGDSRMIDGDREDRGSEAAESKRSTVEGVRVLLVDDNPDNRSIFTLILEDAKVALTAATNGREACDAVEAAAGRGEPFDMIFMDMHMPVMGGLDATRVIRKSGHEMPIVALTAASTSEDATRCMAAGCTSFLTKPIRPDQLVAAVVAHGTEEGSPSAAVPADVPRPEPVVRLESELPDRPEFRELIKTYRVSMRDTLAALTSAIQEEDRSRLLVLTHKIKGSAGCYGFSTVSVLAGSCDTALREEQPLEEVRDALDDLSQMLEQLVAE